MKKKEEEEKEKPLCPLGTVGFCMWGWTLRACSLQAQAWKFIVPSL
jgi:hypothetical protein